MPSIRERVGRNEGLEQEFNSLDAQREACAAYVASQKAESWVLLPTVYEDAGISGGTLERPGLQRLLADIDAGARRPMIVVYKVDRLTRSRSPTLQSSSSETRGGRRGFRLGDPVLCQNAALLK